MGSAWLERRCDEIEGFPPRLKTLLLHLVLSHHGKLEFGSPKQPLFPEALALHYIDDLDSRLEMMRAVTGEIVGEQVWSQYHRGLDAVVLNKEAFLQKKSKQDTPQTSTNRAQAGSPLQHDSAAVEPTPIAPAVGKHGLPVDPPALHPDPRPPAHMARAESDQTPSAPSAPDLFSGSGSAGQNRE
jgi:hypothetical protein